MHRSMMLNSLCCLLRPAGEAIERAGGLYNDADERERERERERGQQTAPAQPEPVNF